MVFDQVMTDTARYADVVLPATTFLEHRELSRGYGAYRAAPHRAGGGAGRRGALEPRGVRRAGAAARTRRAPGIPRPTRSWRRRCSPRPRRRPAPRRAPRSTGDGMALRADRLARRCSSWTCSRAPPTARSTWCPRTSTARRRSASTASSPIPATSAIPLALISPATNRTISSYARPAPPRPGAARAAPGDAAARGLADGDEVRVWNELGEVRCRAARSTADLRPGSRLRCPRDCGAATPSTAPPPTPSRPTTLTDLGGGACFNDARVQVTRAPAP